MPKQDKRAGAQIVLKPVEQVTIPFYGHDLVAVRLEDGRIAAVVRWMCEGMGLDSHAQVQRIQRKTALKNELVTVEVDTGAGGIQEMPALTLHGLPGWLIGIDENRVSEEARPGVILFQMEATDALADYFARRTALQASLSDTLVPSEPIVEPVRPTRDADALTWAEYHEQMAIWLRWRADLEEWREQTDSALAGIRGELDEIHSRQESDEALLRMVPELLERLGPETLSTEHQSTIQALVNRLHDLTGYSQAMIYNDLRQCFHVGKYADIQEAQWFDVAKWFDQRITAAEKRRQHR